MNTYRWFAVIPSAFIGWFIALFAGGFSHGMLIYLCPKDQNVSGMCLANWYSYVEQIHTIFFVSFAAALVVLFPSLMAPKSKLLIAKCVFAIGVIVAIYMAFLSTHWELLPGPFIVGIFSIIYLKKHVLKH